MKAVCKCGSYAINHHCHGRDGSDGDLCDVCYWRKRAEQQAQQEPVAWLDPWTQNNVTTDYDAYGKHGIPLYTSPPAQQELVDWEAIAADQAMTIAMMKAQRKPLTGEEMNQIEARWEASMHGSKIAFVVRETEAAHGIKENT